VNFKGVVLLVSHDRIIFYRTATRIAEPENGTFMVMKWAMPNIWPKRGFKGNTA
jgi:ATPase subunit of ABC transporter with duplicated ATPase domains